MSELRYWALACFTPLIKTHTYILTCKPFRGLLKMSQGLVICFALPATHIIWGAITDPYACTDARLLGMLSVWQSKPWAAETPKAGSFTMHGNISATSYSTCGIKQTPVLRYRQSVFCSLTEGYSYQISIQFVCKHGLWWWSSVLIR